MGKRGFGHVYLRGKIWWVKLHRDGIPHFQSSKSKSKEDAEKLLKELLASDDESPRTDRTMARDLIDDCLRYYEEHRPRSYKDFAVPVSKALLAYFKWHKASQITTEELNKYRYKRKAKGKKPATVNREMAFLRRAFNLGRRATPPKVRTVPYFPMEEENNVRQGFLAPADYERLLSVMEEETKALLVIGYHTGCRMSELLKLRWSNVDLEGSIIRLIDTKNGETREVPIYGDMVSTLADLRERTPKRCPWVFNRAGEQIKDFRHGWERARQAAGLPDLLFHDLRRSAVRNMRLAGIPEKVAMSISGHKTREIFDRYTIVDRDDKQEAGRRLAEYLDTAKKGSKKGSR